ncbi:hypothetical protein [Pendulispora albinea]|uniref:SH3 domain-containing protein n=1 Tax=Pendulispora albinea TaxID=2741071 RepID=A0ABZ2M1U5_9BACT
MRTIRALRTCLVSTALLLALTGTAPAQAPAGAQAPATPTPTAEGSAAADFAIAVDALVGGRAGDAIALFESLADRGVVDENVSFDRGLAYAERVRMGAEQPGDLGRAAHGFEEARALTHNKTLERDATFALGSIRTEVARRRAHSGTRAEVEPNPSVLETIVHLTSEDVWAGAAGVMSLIAGIALFVRAQAKRRRVKISGSTAFAVSAPLCVAFALLAWSARDDRLTLREAVVVNPNARPLDARGIALPNANPLPEGARVRTLSSSSGSTEIQWGTLHAWIPTPAVRPLARRE